jgi:hypothetical protein
MSERLDELRSGNNRAGQFKAMFAKGHMSRNSEGKAIYEYKAKKTKATKASFELEEVVCDECDSVFTVPVIPDNTYVVECPQCNEELIVEGADLNEFAWPFNAGGQLKALFAKGILSNKDGKVQYNYHKKGTKKGKPVKPKGRRPGTISAAQARRGRGRPQKKKEESFYYEELDLEVATVEEIASEVEYLATIVSPDNEEDFYMILDGYLEEIDPNAEMTVFDGVVALGLDAAQALYTDLLGLSYEEPVDNATDIGTVDDLSEGMNVKSVMSQADKLTVLVDKFIRENTGMATAGGKGEQQKRYALLLDVKRRCEEIQGLLMDFNKGAEKLEEQIQQ